MLSLAILPFNPNVTIVSIVYIKLSAPPPLFAWYPSIGWLLIALLLAPIVRVASVIMRRIFFDILSPLPL
jgi:hypothetical protein